MLIVRMPTRFCGVSKKLEHEQPTDIGRARTALQLFERARHGPPTLIDMTNRQSVAHGAVVNMVAHSEANTPDDEQGGSLAASSDPQAPPTHDQGGQADGERDDESGDAAADSQAEYDSLVSSLRQRVGEVEAALRAATATRPHRNPFQTPSTFQTPTVRMGRGGGYGRVLDLNSTPSTHSSSATTVAGSPSGPSPLLSAFCDGTLSSCAHQAEQALQTQQRPSQHGALMGGGSSHQPLTGSILRTILAVRTTQHGTPSVRIGVKKTDKRKLPMDNEFSTMEHLAKAQAGYIRTVNELREKVAELEGNKLITFIRDKLSRLLKHIAGAYRWHHQWY